jgi:tRNA A37 methylthiotransferase MiaB
VTQEVAASRLEQVIALHKEQLDTKMPLNIGRSFEVLFEQQKDQNTCVGFSDNGHQIQVKHNKELSGVFANIKITNFHRTYLEGELS